MDFDAFASLVAAKKIYPEATIVMTDKQNAGVKQFLAIHRDSIDYIFDHQVKWQEVTHVILVDVATLSRVSDYVHHLPHSVHFTIYDHHPYQDGDVQTEDKQIEPVGATITLLVEKIMEKEIPINGFEATIFGLGLYTDTGSFTFSTTTARDLKIGSYLLEKGMQLTLVNRFSDQMLLEQQQTMFNELLLAANEHSIDGLNILVTTLERKKFEGGLAVITRKLLETTGADAILSVVEMQKRVYVVGRGSSNRINLLPLMYELGGGGHERAASATIKNNNLETVCQTVIKFLTKIVKPAITAEVMMTEPVKTMEPTTTIKEAANLMYRYGHTGFPVVQPETEQLIGIISRRDIDKATHHGLGHAPVKAYMSGNVLTVQPNTSLEEIEQIMIKHNIGRLPVVKDKKIIGILSRTNIIEVLYNEQLKRQLELVAENPNNLQKIIAKQLSSSLYDLLKNIGVAADECHIHAFLIGGIVRDILLKRENDDIDIAVEGDGISFAHYLVAKYGGTCKIHESFGTATWKHPEGMKIDIATSRLEYYQQPAALPTVEYSNLKEDLYRRDFTINAMALCLNAAKFGELVDFFNGREDLQKHTIRILHNLSFVEDPTRIIRAVRFETRFGFHMDTQTKELALLSLDKLKKLSAIRITNELYKLFCEESPAKGFSHLTTLGFWKELAELEGNEQQWNETALTFETLIKKVNIPFQLTWFGFLLIPFLTNPNWKVRIEPFALTTKEKKLMEQLNYLIENENQTLLQAKTKGELHLQLKQISTEAILPFICNKVLANESFELFVSYVIARKKLKPFINGEDLKKLGIPTGPIYSKLLESVEAAQLNEEVLTKQEALELLKKINNNA